MANMQLMKLFLFVVNFFIFVFSWAIIVLSSYSLIKLRGLRDLVPSLPLEHNAVAAALSSLAVLVTFLGCCGSIKQSRCALCLFSTVAAGMAVVYLTNSYFFLEYANQNDGEKIGDQLQKNMEFYETGNPMKKAWDTLQYRFECCGAVNSSDWLLNAGSNATLPLSCCFDPNDKDIDDSEECTDDEAFSRPCSTVVAEFFVTKACGLGGLLLFMSIVWLIASFFGCGLICEKRLIVKR